jgi:hypothetical protein
MYDYRKSPPPQHVRDVSVSYTHNLKFDTITFTEVYDVTFEPLCKMV